MLILRQAQDDSIIVTVSLSNRQGDISGFLRDHQT
jgi:hypothetical protein